MISLLVVYLCLGGWLRLMSVKRIEQLLDAGFKCLVQQLYDRQDPLCQVIRYVLEARGKRVRAKLCLLTARGFGQDYLTALPAALALEMVHAYSLVHDDLPCMDNDVLRRGRATAHVRFGQAEALLAGDALLTDAFRVLTDSEIHQKLGLSSPWPPAKALACVRRLAQACGSQGMVNGQSLDMFWTSRSGYCADDLFKIHAQKTGALIAVSCTLGAIIANQNEIMITNLNKAGELIGQAYQIIDDLLDNVSQTGKSSGKDEKLQKLTYMRVMSPSEAQRLAREFSSEARSIVQSNAGDLLNELLGYFEFMLERKS